MGLDSAVAALVLLGAAHAADTVTVGSKRFTESYILGEIAVQRIESAGQKAVHRQGLGNTAMARGDDLRV